MFFSSLIVWKYPSIYPSLECGARHMNLHIQGCAMYYARGDSVKELETEIKNAFPVCRGVRGRT